MPRRASSSVPIGKLLLGLGGVLALMLGGFAFMAPSNSLRTTSLFPMKDYLENADSLRGNTYQIEATVDQTLSYSPETGRLISVEAPGGELLPILVPKSIPSNLERGQKLLFQVKVESKGLVTASDVRKP